LNIVQNKQRKEGKDMLETALMVIGVVLLLGAMVFVLKKHPKELDDSDDLDLTQDKNIITEKFPLEKE
jgi:hypothetical protein